MHALILAATYERKLNGDHREVPQPLVDIQAGEPYLTTLANRLVTLPGLHAIDIVTNEVIKAELQDWAARYQAPEGVSIRVLGDGTSRPQDRLGAVGDIIFTIREAGIQDDTLIIGGDNWFTYKLNDFVEKARDHTPAVVVARVISGTHSARFGWVQVDDEGRIIRFYEHPTGSAGGANLKASCVYYLARSDLRWLETFSQDRSTVCSPGTFFAWLAERIPVYGIEMSSWVDISPSKGQALTGADFLEFRDLIRVHADPRYSTWERPAARKLLGASCHDDLIEALTDSDTNVRIIAALLLGRTSHLISQDEKNLVVDALVRLLADPSQNEIEVEGFEHDQEVSHHVSATAAEALAVLGYAETASAVFERARREGKRVQETRNIG